MKQVRVILLVALATVAGCRASAPVTKTEQNIYVRVECRNEPSTRSYVLQLLRSPNARDLTTTPDGAFLEIEVVYANISKETFAKLEQVEDQLKRYPGVVTVEIRNPVREVRQVNQYF